MLGKPEGGVDGLFIEVCFGFGCSVDVPSYDFASTDAITIDDSFSYEIPLL